MARKLNDDERELWDKVAQDLSRIYPSPPKRDLEPSAKAAPKTKASPTAKDAAESPAVPALNLTRDMIGSRAPNARAAGAPPAQARPARPPVVMDRKIYGKMRSGKLEPTARIDLHGMTLDQAHPSLIRFVTRCHERQERLILVITGKGRASRDEGPIPTPKGVLRQSVPMWCRQAPLGPLVLQVTPAHRRHGGEGAYYIYLRRSAR